MTRSIFVSTTMGRPVRLLGAVAAAVGLAAAIAFGMQWWGEWPLRSAERELAGGNAVVFTAANQAGDLLDEFF